MNCSLSSNALVFLLPLVNTTTRRKAVFEKAETIAGKGLVRVGIYAGNRRGNGDQRLDHLRSKTGESADCRDETDQ